MKVCILSTVNIKHMTMVSFFTNILESYRVNYDVIYIDKYHDLEKLGASANHYAYKVTINKNWSNLKKLAKYLGFKKFAMDIISKKKYDFIVVWNSFTALMFKRLLVSKYSGRYCLNIRDYFYERNPLVYNNMRQLVKRARFSTISSNGFRIFLPYAGYLTMHSINSDILKNVSVRNVFSINAQPIRISFIGYVRFLENDRMLIDALGNDNRYMIQYFGVGSDTLHSYAFEKGYHNVVCKGSFSPEETKDFLERTDIVNNLYGVGKLSLDTALSIKLYYAIFLNIPVLVYRGTFGCQIAEKCGIGFPVSKDEFHDLGDRLYEWYSKRDISTSLRLCREYVENAKEENALIEKAFTKCIN